MPTALCPSPSTEVACCPHEVHETIKQEGAWEAATYYVGPQRSYARDEDPALPDFELHNCKRCESTLVRARRVIGDDE